MAVFKEQQEQETLKEAGKRLATVLDELILNVRPGVTGAELDKHAYELITHGGDTPAFLNYTPEGAPFPFPATVCVSVNDAIVHGIPSERPFQEGDTVGLDIGLVHNGIIVDMAKTVPVGAIPEEDKRVMEVTQKALDEGIRAARVGGHIGDIGAAIEDVVKKSRMYVVEELGGHGVGRKVHEEPFVANVGKRGEGPEIVSGMTLALEPIANATPPRIMVDDDGYTVRTDNGSRTAHFEHTVLITERGAEIVTKK